MKIHYLEIVCPNPKETAESLGIVHGAEFAGPVGHFGNAYIMTRQDGSRIGVRAPMHESETPVTRPYILCSNVKAAVEALEARGVIIMHPPLEIPGEGTFAIYMENDIQYGLWEV